MRPQLPGLPDLTRQDREAGGIARQQPARRGHRPPGPFHRDFSHPFRGTGLIAREELDPGPDRGKSHPRREGTAKGGEPFLLGRTKRDQAQARPKRVEAGEGVAGHRTFGIKPHRRRDQQSFPIAGEHARELLAGPFQRGFGGAQHRDGQTSLGSEPEQRHHQIRPRQQIDGLFREPGQPDNRIAVRNHHILTRIGFEKCRVPAQFDEMINVDCRQSKAFAPTHQPFHIVKQCGAARVSHLDTGLLDGELQGDHPDRAG